MYDFGSIGIYYYYYYYYIIFIYIFYLIITHVQSIVVKFHRLNKRNNTAMFNHQL